MTDERNKSSGSTHSSPRPTARDVPFTRGAGSESEPAPRGQRPAQLPRDPTYEAELAQVELAVLRDPTPKEDPSTKPGRRAAPGPKPPAPESVTPESPTAGLSRRPTVPSPEPPVSPHGRSVASGTLLSVGAVDPRGKTERTLETPRMFISQQQGSEAYFKPGKIPAVTVHQTIETDTVKLSDSIDPRRAKTMPRIDRSALQHLADTEPEEEPSDYSLPRSSLDVSSAQSPHWNQAEWDAHDEDEELPSGNGEGQIHASLSPFREQAGASSFSLDGVSTRPEPLAARRSDLPPPVSAPPAPDTSTVPTHRDLPVHRIEASQPPPPPPGKAQPLTAPRAPAATALGGHERASARPTAVTEELPLNRPVWINYAAFFAALVFAVVIGLWLTRGSEPRRSAPISSAPARVLAPRALEPAHPGAAPAAQPPVPVATAVSAPAKPSASEPEAVATARPVAVPAPIEKAAPSATASRVRAPVAPQNGPAAPEVSAAPRKSNTSKTTRETIF